MSVAAPDAAVRGGVEAALQRRQGATHPRLDGAERLAHLARDFGVAEALEERERDALALAWRELVHARRERAGIGGPAQQIERAGRLIRHGVVHVVVLGVAAAAGWSGSAHLGLGLLAAQAVDGAVARNAREPREGLTLRRVEAARRPPDVDVHLLQDVFGLGSIAVDTQHDSEQMRARALVERGKSRTVAESGMGQQARQIVAALGPVGGGFEHGFARKPMGLRLARLPTIPAPGRLTEENSWPVPSRPHRPSSPPTTSSSSCTTRCGAATSSASWACGRTTTRSAASTRAARVWSARPRSALRSRRC